MSDALMFYHEIAPSSEIAHLVLSFWEFFAQSEMSEPIVHEVFPDSCVSLIYKRNKSFGINALFIHGLSLEIFRTAVFAGDVFWGMRLMPSACAKILRSDPARVQTQLLSDSNDFKHLTEGLLEKLIACANFSEAIECYDAKIKSLKLNPEETDEKLIEAVRIIEQNCGEVKISDLARAVGVSVRQLERRFRKSAGLSPKKFARARRIRATAVNLVEKSEMNWANRAAEMGFTDQAHLAREFSLLMGRSPNSFAEKVKRIEHGNFTK